MMIEELLDAQEVLVEIKDLSVSFGSARGIAQH